MKTEETKFHLELKHPSRDLSLVCATLEMRPAIIWRRGDERRTSKGTRIGGKRDNSRCAIELKFPPRQPLGQKIVAALALLKPHRILLRRLASSGGTNSFYIGWFCDADTGVTIDTETIAAMADLRIAVELFVYPPDKKRRRKLAHRR